MGKNEISPIADSPVWQVSEQTALANTPVQSSGVAAAPRSEMNITNLFRILSQWRWVILGCLAAGLGIGLIATLLATPMYRAQASLELNPPQVEVLGKEKGGRPVLTNDREFLATQYGLLKSRVLAERVARELNLARNSAIVPEGVDRATGTKMAAARLQSDLEVKPLPLSRLVEISFVSEDPSLAARITNAYAETFMTSHLERGHESSAYARRFLEQQIGRLKRELENTERRLVAYAQQQNLVAAASSSSSGAEGQAGSSSGGGSLSAASLTSMNEALNDATKRRIAAEQRYRQSLSVTQTTDVQERVEQLRGQLAGLQAEYRQKATQFRDEYPDMLRLRSQINSLEQAIQNESRRAVSGRSNTLLAEYRAAQNEERELQGRVQSLRSAVLDERGRSIQYNILQRELDTNRSLYDALLQRYREIGIAGSVGTNVVSIVDRADPPSQPYSPNLMLNLLIGSGLGFLLGSLVALALEILNDVVASPDDVRDKLRLTPLGVIPKTNVAGSFVDALGVQGSALYEAYFSLTGALQFSTDTGTPKTLLITSTRAAEGKSSTTLALAQNLARIGNKVLLIDADMRKPAFVTSVDNVDGLSKLLTNAEPLRSCVLNTDQENFYMIPCGSLPPNPAELLSSPRLQTLLIEATSQFDLVIVDGPPVLGLADAPLIASVCRGTLLIIESGKTRTKAAAEALSRLRGAGGHVLGAVLTKFNQRAHGYGYGYGYGYGEYKSDGKRDPSREIKLVTTREHT